MAQHVFNEDGVCVKCGFDGAEAYHLRQTLKAEIGPDEYLYRLSQGEFKWQSICPVEGKDSRKSNNNKTMRDATLHNGIFSYSL